MEKPVLLLAFANDLNAYLPEVRTEIRNLQDMLERDSHPYRPVFRSHTRPEDLVATLQHQDYQDQIAIFHFAGHADEQGLRLEGSDTGTVHVNMLGVASMLQAQRRVPLVILNACSSNRFVDVLLEHDAPCVIATSHDIEDKAALFFSTAFYRALLNPRNTLERAFRDAKGAAIMMMAEATADTWLMTTHPEHTDLPQKTLQDILGNSEEAPKATPAEPVSTDRNQRKIQQLNQLLHMLDEQLSRLGESKILETRVEEKMRLDKLIAEKEEERAGIESQLKALK